MTKSEPTVTVHVPKIHKSLLKKRIPASLMFVAFAATALIGYVTGTYNSQILAAVGPVFGYKPHAASLDLSSLQTLYTNLAANFDGTLDTSKLIDGAKHGLIAAAGDTYTVFMNKKETTTFNNDLSGNIGGGIGAAISAKNGQPVVSAVLDNNPAKIAGIQIGDVITSVNDQSAVGWTVEQTVGKIRGDAGTTVKIGVARNGNPLTFSVTRAIINDPSVTSSIDGELGTITISRFDTDTGSLARAAAQGFVSKGVKKVILDLRDNGGGYLSAAQDVAGLWLNDQVVVTERSGSTVTDTIKSENNPLFAGLPTVILVNGNSASASEIVSGALQDYGVAQLVGEKTFGKGSVQKVISLDGGTQLKVTIAKWYTPKGKNINQQGITPNITATLTQANVDAGIDPQLDAAKKALGL